jgi:hypothetical protein
MSEIQNSNDWRLSYLRFGYCHLEFIWPNFKIRWFLRFAISGSSGDGSLSHIFKTLGG